MSIAFFSVNDLYTDIIISTNIIPNKTPDVSIPTSITEAVRPGIKL